VTVPPAGRPTPASPGPAAEGAGRRTSPRREELLELAWRHVLSHGLADMSLRPLAKAVHSSPRVLLFIFGSKDGLVRALLERARGEELAAVEAFRRDPGATDLVTSAARVWSWLSAPAHGDLLKLWVEAYARSLVDPSGPWGGFAAATVEDWLDLLASLPPRGRSAADDRDDRTAVLALLRGALLDLLATGDVDRTTRAVGSALRRWAAR